MKIELKLYFEIVFTIFSRRIINHTFNNYVYLSLENNEIKQLCILQHFKRILILEKYFGGNDPNVSQNIYENYTCKIMFETFFKCVYLIMNMFMFIVTLLYHENMYRINLKLHTFYFVPFGFLYDLSFYFQQYRNLFCR